MPTDHPGLSLDNPVSALDPTARYILETARRLLQERGYDALTMESIALESRESKVAITHHFGSKAGLIEKLLDSFSHDTWMALSSEIAQMPPGEERVVAYVRGLKRLLEDPETFVGFFTIAPHVLRNPTLRARISGLYGWWRHLTLEACAVPDGATPRQQRRLATVAALLLASMDGVAFQLSLDPDAIDGEYAFELVADMAKRAFSQLGEAEG